MLDDTPTMRAARECFHAYRKGWRDGATAKVQDVRYTRHKTRVDLKRQYEAGHRAGLDAMYTAFAREAERVGYDPMFSILRGDPELQPEIDAVTEHKAQGEP